VTISIIVMLTRIEEKSLMKLKLLEKGLVIEMSELSGVCKYVSLCVHHTLLHTLTPSYFIRSKIQSKNVCINGVCVYV